LHHTGLRHNALVYESDEAYVERSTAFLRSALEAGEGALAAGTRDRLALVREGLDGDAREVSFVDNGSTYTRPARTLAAYYRLLNDVTRDRRAARLVAEVDYGPTPAEWEQWAAYEAIFNVANAHLPAWVVCTYNGSTLPDRMRESVWQSHPEVAAQDLQHSEQFEDPATMVRALTPDPRPLPGLRSIPPGDDLEGFRERLSCALDEEGVAGSKALDMLVAANEVASNALRHGGELVELRVGRDEGRFVCEVSDSGSGFDDPLAGYIPPRDERQSGPGLWVARQLARRVEFLPSPDRFTVRLWL
jgi:anti-sigma regulatory factor (Ser/Thr protein kinase)